MFCSSAVALVVETAASPAVAAERVDSLPSLFLSALHLVLAVFTPSRLVREARLAAQVPTRCLLMRPPLLLVDEAVVRHTQPTLAAVVGAVTDSTAVSSERAALGVRVATAAQASGLVLGTSLAVVVAAQAQTGLIGSTGLLRLALRRPMGRAALAATVRPMIIGLAAGSPTEAEVAVAPVTPLMT
jgi:hypothetical protein